MVEGTFTGFLKSLAENDVNFAVEQKATSVVIRVSRFGKSAMVELPRSTITEATEDIASVELGEIISVLL